MKQEDKYIDHLFESAREEAPQRSFEDVAEVFASSTSPTLFGVAKGWFLNNINFNSILLFSATTLGIITMFLFSSSNNSSNNTSTENQVVTNQINNSSSFQTPDLKSEEESINILPLENSNIPSAKNIKTSVNFSKSKTEFQQFKKKIISESPILVPISQELKFDIIKKIPLVPSIKNFEEKNSISDFQRKYKTSEKVFSPWVVGQESEMPWKIKKKFKTPILNETERVLQQFMNTKYLEQIFEKKENGYFKPLIMLTHYSLNENNFVHFKGEKIRLLNEEISPDFNPNDPFINVKKFKIKKSKAFFSFSYKDFHVQMQLRRVDEGWKRHKLKVKENKEVKVNMTF